jgi:hypothetical protein
MIRRFLTRVLMVILIGISGYNGWQIQRMQGEMTGLQGQLAAIPRHPAGQRAESKAPDAAAQSWLDRAELHAERARAAVARADFGTAQTEVAAGIADVHRAALEPEARTQATLTEARQTLQSLQAQADVLWRRAHGSGTPSVP